MRRNLEIALTTSARMRAVGLGNGDSGEHDHDTGER